MSKNPTLYTLQVDPPCIIALSVEDGSVLYTIDAKWGTPDGLWIDPNKKHIFWTNMGADYSAADGTIERADLDGGNHVTIVGKGAIVTPKQMAADPKNDHLYWCDREGMRIMRSNFDGSDVVTLLTRGDVAKNIEDVSRHCVGITLDLDARQLYWTQKGPPKGGTGQIFRMPLDLPKGVDPAKRQDVELLIDHLPEPIDLELCTKTKRLYWTDRGAEPDGNSLNVATVDKQGLHNHVVIMRGLEEGIGLAIDKNEKYAFVSDLGGQILKVDIATGKTHLLRKQGATTGIAIF